MKKQIVYSLLASVFMFCLTISSYAAETWKKVVVAVPEADVFFTGGVDANYASMVTDKLISAFESSGKIETKNDSDIEQIMKTMAEAQTLGSEGACKTDDKCMLRIAQKMQVGYIAKIKVIQNDSVYSVTIRMIKVNADRDLEQISRDVDSKKRISDLVTSIGMEINTAFPALEAKIKVVDEDKVYIDHGSSSGLKKDFAMIVKRKVVKKDDEGNVVHESYQELGRIVLEDVSAASSQGITKKGKNFQKGDSVFVDESQILKDMKAKEDARKKEYTPTKDSSDDKKSNSDGFIANYYIRAGIGSGEMKDPLLSEIYGSCTPFMVEFAALMQPIGINSFGMYVRYTQRNYEMLEGTLNSPVAVTNGIISSSDVTINSGDLGFRYYLGPEFEWISAKLYLSAALRLNLYKESAQNGIMYNFTALGYMYGAGVEVILFDTLGVFAEYNGGSCKIGKSARDIEGQQILAGLTLKI